jgi:hypothetical protein
MALSLCETKDRTVQLTVSGSPEKYHNRMRTHVSTDWAAYIFKDETVTTKHVTYENFKPDSSVILAEGSEVALSHAVVSKAGHGRDCDSMFWGRNSAIVVV